MSFLQKQTPDTERAISALQKIFDHTSPRAAAATYATALNDRLLANWMKTEHVKQARGRICVHRLTGKKCTQSLDCTPPGTDHATLWSKNGKPAILVSQPYSFGMEMSEMVNEYCKGHGLTYRIVADSSFYYPAVTLLIAFWLKED
jgi:hypothetical protein